MRTRWKITIEYDGQPFVGWQRQNNGSTIQEAIENAIHAFSQESVTLYGAGRTDSGVHALGQSAHFDLSCTTSPDTVRDAINFHLRPLPIVILNVEKTYANFHARVDAVARHYKYRILNRRSPPTIDIGRVWHIPHKLDIEKMADAATTLIGKHDFTSFRAAACQASSPIKTLMRLEIHKVKNEIHIEADARSFLHHQVRNIVGTLRLVGEGKWCHADVEQALAARDRSAAGPTAPAEGLYLTSVDY